MKPVSSPTERESILGRLRAAQPRHPLPQPDLSDYLRGPFAAGVLQIDPASAGDAVASRAQVGNGTVSNRSNSEALIAQFEGAARGWRAEVHRVIPAHCMAAVRALLQDKKCKAIATGSPPMPPTEWDVAFDGFDHLRFDGSTNAWKPTLFDAIDASVTLAVAAIADTGSLVLIPGPHEPRSLSLVPPIHVALVRVSTLFASLAAAMQALAPQSDMPTNFLLVTGPSKTADIQQTLAYGAHGPKELIIVLIDDRDGPTGVQS